MEDLFKHTEYIQSHNITLFCTYKLNFDASRNCGAITIYNGREINEESFELFMEYLECNLTEEQIMDRIKKLKEEISSGKLDVSI